MFGDNVSKISSFGDPFRSRFGGDGGDSGSNYTGANGGVLSVNQMNSSLTRKDEQNIYRDSSVFSEQA